VDCQEYDNEDPNQYQRVVAFLLYRLIEPTLFFHPAGRSNGVAVSKPRQALAVRSEGLDVVVPSFISPRGPDLGTVLSTRRAVA